MNQIDIQCPYCWETFGVSISHEDGEQQSFVYDCEVCCNPIQIEATADTTQGDSPEDIIWSLNLDKAE